MQKKSCLGLMLVFLALGFFPAAATEVSMHLSPLLLWPIGPADSEGETGSLFAFSVGRELSFGLSLGMSFGGSRELRAGFALVPLVLNVDDRDSAGLIASAKAGLGLLFPFAGQSTLAISGGIGIYTLRYKDTHYEPAFCFDLDARLQKEVVPWLALFGGVGYSSYLVEFSSEALLNAVHLKAGLSILL